MDVQGPSMGQKVRDIKHVGKEAGVKGSRNKQGVGVYTSKILKTLST